MGRGYFYNFFSDLVLNLKANSNKNRDFYLQISSQLYLVNLHKDIAEESYSRSYLHFKVIPLVQGNRLIFQTGIRIREWLYA